MPKQWDILFRKTNEPIIFIDNASIESWAIEAVTTMQQAGIIKGKNGNNFDPIGETTRAESSAILRRYIECVIDNKTT